MTSLVRRPELVAPQCPVRRAADEGAPMSSALPDGVRLEFGVATASYQIEGAPDADGKGPSIWDTFTRVPGAIDDASDGSVACASYPDPGPDIDLVTGLGVGWYRFSM